MRTIDIHTHVLADATIKLLQKEAPRLALKLTPIDSDNAALEVAGVRYTPFPRGGHDIARRFADMDAAEVDMHVLSAAPQTWAYNANFKPWPDQSDPAKAKEAAQASGHGGDRIVITTANDDTLVATATVIHTDNCTNRTSTEDRENRELPECAGEPCFVPTFNAASRRSLLRNSFAESLK